MNLVFIGIIKDLIERNKMSRQCGTCTKCCDGTVAGVIRGHKMFPGQKCFFLGENGCSDYKNRPIFPCRMYKCLWLSDESVPDYFKPENVKAILDIEEFEGIKYLRINKGVEQYDENIIDFGKQYAKKNNLTFIWTDNNNVSHFIGNKELYIKILKNNKEMYTKLIIN